MKDAGQVRPSPPELLITAAEAYPAFERRMLGAKEEVVMGFRIFDPLTRLRSPEAREVGETWVDLLEHTVNRGVRVEIHLSDFDPVAATSLHRLCWRCVRVLCGLRELLGDKGDLLEIHPELHPAKTGFVARVFFWPFVSARVRQIYREHAGQKPSHRERMLKYVPGVAYFTEKFRGPLLSFPASHHQKLASFDKRWLYIGGLDLNERRWDDHGHLQPAQDTWHDVQVLVDDPVAATSAVEHLRTYCRTAFGAHEVAETPGLLRTLSRDNSRKYFWSLVPHNVVRELLDAHLDGTAETEKLIYLETQFFRDRGLARALAKRAREEPGLKLILVLPAAPDSIAFFDNPQLDGRYGDFLQSRCIRIMRRAFGRRMLVASPVQPRQPNGDDIDVRRARLHGSPIIYVHAKVSLFDDRKAIISSANLNGRSLYWDTEAGVSFDDPGTVRMIRERSLRHWLGGDVPDADLTPESAFETLRHVLYRNSKCAPEKRRGFLVPYDRKAAEDSALSMPGVPEEMV
jgi:phospholipase D1/2